MAATCMSVTVQLSAVCYFFVGTNFRDFVQKYAHNIKVSGAVEFYVGIGSHSVMCGLQ